MREFYFEDKKKHISYRGLIPTNDTDWSPIQYAIIPHAYNRAKNYIDMYKHGAFKGLVVNDKFFYDKAYAETIEFIIERIHRSKISSNLLDLLKYEELPKRQQEKLLKNLTLSPDDILCFLCEADIHGYLLDIYMCEKYPERYKGKLKPACYEEKSDGTIETIGKTDMTEGEMRALIKDRKVIVARIFHKGDHWHCFYHTFKGLSGEESGENGSKPHWHYISDKFNISREELNKRIQNVDMPTSKVHIFIERK